MVPAFRSIWSLWEPLAGASIGIKKAAKTVLTGVELVDGLPAGSGGGWCPPAGGILGKPWELDDD